MKLALNDIKKDIRNLSVLWVFSSQYCSSSLSSHLKWLDRLEGQVSYTSLPFRLLIYFYRVVKHREVTLSLDIYYLDRVDYAEVDITG